LFSAKGIIGTVAAVALTVFIGYTISNYVDRIQLKNALKSGFKNELSTFDLGVNFENHSGKSLVRNCYGRKYSTVNYDFSPLLGVNDQELEGNIQNYFKDIDNVIDNKFAHSLSYKFFAAKAPNQSKFGLVMEGC
jgi:hypothetical protein